MVALEFPSTEGLPVQRGIRELVQHASELDLEREGSAAQRGGAAACGQQTASGSQTLSLEKNQKRGRDRDPRQKGVRDQSAAFWLAGDRVLAAGTARGHELPRRTGEEGLEVAHESDDAAEEDLQPPLSLSKRVRYQRQSVQVRLFFSADLLEPQENSTCWIGSSQN